MAQRLFLLDGMALIYRAHFALIRAPIFTSDGLNTSALYGFTNTLLDILQNQKPTHIAVAFDTSAPTTRHEIFPEYKAQREEMPEDISAAIPHVKRLLAANDDPHDDSPLFALIEDMPRMEVDHSKTDLFRDRIHHSREIKSRLADARRSGIDSVREIAAAMPTMRNVEAGIVVDLFLSYRAVKAWQEMVDHYGLMSRELQQTRMVQEQLAFALNRLGRSEEAEAILKQTIGKFGPSSETTTVVAGSISASLTGVSTQVLLETSPSSHIGRPLRV
jgi:hypothetical protein